MSDVSRTAPRRVPLAITCVLVAIGLSACGGPTYLYHYRTTLEVETATGVKSGSSVQQIAEHDETIVYGPMGQVVSKLRGEAVTVDLGDGRAVFATMRRWGQRDSEGKRSIGSDIWTPTQSILDRRGAKNIYLHGRNSALAALVRRPERQPILLTSDEMPILVTFSDRNNPNSARIVDPEGLATSLGGDIRFVRMTVTMTRDPVTRGVIVKYLPWMPQIVGYINGATTSRGSVLTLDSGDFIRR